MESVTSEFTVLEDDGFATVRLRSLEFGSVPDRILDNLRGTGLFLRLSILWQMEFIQLSPMLIHYILTDNKSAATSPGLVDAVAPILSHRLSKWPPARSTNGRLCLNPAQDPLNLILASSSDSGLTVSYHFLNL